MKVVEIAKRLGVSSSKVRYYDRSGITSTVRNDDNNYRDFTFNDGLNIYNAMMLRSFDLSMDEVVANKKQNLDDLTTWFDKHIETLELELEFEKIKIQRLKEMQDYFIAMQNKNFVNFSYLDGHYSVYNLSNKQLTPSEQDFINQLIQVLPFSYIALKINKDSIKENEKIDVEIGLGILEKNCKKLNIKPGKDICYVHAKNNFGYYFECEDPFNISYEQLIPILNYCHDHDIAIDRDLMGRIFIGYQSGDKYVYGCVLGL